MAFPQFEVLSTTSPINIEQTCSGASGTNAVYFSLTASSTASSQTAHGSSEGLYILQTISGVHTETAKVEGLSIVQTVSGSGTSPYIYGAHIHWHNTGNPTIGNLMGLQIDMDNPGSACGNCMALDVYRDGANNAACRDCMIRCANGGSATVDEAILLEGKYSAVFELTIQGGTVIPEAVGGSQTHKIPVNVVNIAGETGTIMYIPLQTA